MSCIVDLMRANSRFLVPLLALMVASVQFASAQMPMLGPDPKMMVLTQPEVRKDIKVTKEQSKQIEEIMKEASKADPSMGGNPMSMFGELDAKVVAVLTPEQQVRLTQLWIQYDGPVVLEDKAIAEELKLTDEQKSKVKELWDVYQNQFLEKMRSGPMGIKAMKAVRKTTNEATLALLTPEQQKAFTDMQGKELKFRAKRDY